MCKGPVVLGAVFSVTFSVPCLGGDEDFISCCDVGDGDCMEIHAAYVECE
jgi:hypothetical protein